MKWHFFTKNGAPFKYENLFSINSLNEKTIINEYLEENKISLQELNAKKLIEYILDNYSKDIYDDLIFNCEEPLSDLSFIISTYFDFPNTGEFDWEEETSKYYNLFAEMTKWVECEILFDSGKCLHRFNCLLSEDDSFCIDIISSELNITFPDFNLGNGEPLGVVLALDIINDFMEKGSWHFGFYDKNNNLINDIALWSKNNSLNIDEIKPILWFGRSDVISKCWSIGIDTSNLTLYEFWGDFFNALSSICGAESIFYYTICEYGLDYNEKKFEDIKKSCPIKIKMTKKRRINELYNKIITIYNSNKREFDEEIPNNLYLKKF